LKRSPHGPLILGGHIGYIAVEDGDKGAGASAEHRWHRGQKEPPGTDIDSSRYLSKNNQDDCAEKVAYKI